MGQRDDIRELWAEVRELRRRVQMRPILVKEGGGADAPLPWAALLVRTGNRVITTPTNVYGIKRYAGETKATTWKFVHRRARATATLSSGAISALTLTDCGIGYAEAPADPPDVTVSAPPGGGTQAVVTATIAADGDRVEGVYITACGTNYTTATITFDAAPVGGVTAVGSALIRDGKIVSITVSNKGRGYTSTPGVTITGDGTSATAVAVRGTGAVTLAITNAGAGYTTAPTITIDAPPVGVSPAPPNLDDDTPDAWDDGLGWGTANGGSLGGTLSEGQAVLIVHDDRGMVAYGLMGDGAGGLPYTRAVDSVLTWYQTLVRLTIADADADGVLPAWVPMSGGV